MRRMSVWHGLSHFFLPFLTTYAFLVSSAAGLLRTRIIYRQPYNNIWNRKQILLFVKDVDFEDPDSVSAHLQDALRNILVGMKDNQPDQTPAKELEFGARKRLMCTRLSTSTSLSTEPLVYVDDSTVTGAGRGLFASKDVRAGEILTCYPGDALIDTGAILISKSGVSKEHVDEGLTENGVLWGEHVPDHLRLQHQESILRPEYQLQTSIDEWSIVAMPELGAVDTGYLGHFANDGIPSPPSCPSELSSYVLASNELQNAMHRDILGCHMVTVATKDIQKGQEIFVTYGPEYWMQHDGFDSDGSRSRTTTGKSNGRGFG